MAKKVTYVRCRDCMSLHYKVSRFWALNDSKLTGTPLEDYRLCDDCEGKIFNKAKVQDHEQGQSIPPVLI